MAILSISAITGLTLPGILLEPGCTAGNRISSRPVAGPEDMRRKSFAIRVKVIASVWREAEKLAESDNRLHRLKKFTGFFL